MPVKEGSLLSPQTGTAFFPKLGSVRPQKCKQDVKFRALLCTISINLYAQLGFCYIEGIHTVLERLDENLIPFFLRSVWGHCKQKIL